MDDGLMLVEWPERAPSLKHRADVAVRLSYRGPGRLAELSALSPRAAALLGPVIS
jgi:tRNA A37 threonylcarbamoyladenosine biosynthesis protein TsaE